MPLRVRHNVFDYRAVCLLPPPSAWPQPADQMALLFVGGIMNVLWIVLLASLILLEKITPLGRLIAPLAGTVLIAAGAWLLSTVMS